MYSCPIHIDIRLDTLLILINEESNMKTSNTFMMTIIYDFFMLKTFKYI